MNTNVKLLVSFSLLIIVLGVTFLWSGLKPQNLHVPISSPVSKVSPRPTLLPDQAFPEPDLEGEKALVTKVIDGDTIELESGQRVRLIGVDTPETKDPRRAVECFGKQSAAKTKELLEGKVIILQKDVSEVDKYNRLLRYVFLPIDEGFLFVNDYLIREGFAKALTYPPDVKYSEKFRSAERKARESAVGLWRSC